MSQRRLIPFTGRDWCINKDDGSICNESGEPLFVRYQDIMGDEELANAKVAAAGPDLYYALKSLCEAIREYDPNDFHFDLREAEEALGKARFYA